MSKLAVPTSIPSMCAAAVDKVRALESEFAALPQLSIETLHTIHAGVYTRTICIPAGATITGALIKCATTLVISGHVVVYLDGAPEEFKGYHVLPASAHRKQAFHALQDTHLTMLFATKAEQIADAENEFTDEAAMLCSRLPGNANYVHITGE